MAPFERLENEKKNNSNIHYYRKLTPVLIKAFETNTT